MPRRKLSEYRSKILIAECLNAHYIGWSVDDQTGADLVTGYDAYVVKVDQAVKGRFKQGLVLLDISEDKLKNAINQLEQKAYSQFIIEPYTVHKQEDERYLAIARGHEGLQIFYSVFGGVDIEAHSSSVVTAPIDSRTNWEKIAQETGVSAEHLQNLVSLFNKNYFVSLEINPYIINEDTISILDVAIEVDDAGQYFTDKWSQIDIRNPRKSKSTEQENEVLLLNANSPASFNLTVLNPDGSIFLLLSGGGASIVIADEVYNKGIGDELANYGEYSGNPTTDETYTYTKQLLELVVASNAPKKVIFIGGAVANFTDIASTFAGIIRAIDEQASILKKQGIKVYVRRGGPNQEQGLVNIKKALSQHDIVGGVYGPEVSISTAVSYMREGLNK